MSFGELIRARNDRASHHVLWVANDGEVHVSPVPKDTTPLGFQQSHPEMKLRLGTFEAGNGYVGAEAAEDRDWINQLFDAVAREWSKAKR